MSNQSTIKVEDLNIILCPNCKKKIPILKVVSEEGYLTLQIQCTCEKKTDKMKLEKFIQNIKEYNKPEEHKCYREKHAQQKAEKYCSNCLKWMCEDCLDLHKDLMKDHIMRNRELLYNCETHKLNFLNRYCEECKTSLCEECVKVHDQSHHFSHPDQIDINSCDKDLDKIKVIMEANEVYKDNFNTSMDALSNSIKGWKTDFNEAYSVNKQKHLQLKEFSNIMQHSSKLIDANKDYCLNQSVNKFIESLKTELQNARTVLENSYKNYQKKYTEEISATIISIRQMKTVIKSDVNIPQVNKHTNECLDTKEIKQDLFAMIQLEDGRLITGGNDTRVKQLNVDTFQCEELFKAHSNWITSMALLQDGRVVSGGNDNMIKIWNIDTYEMIRSMKGHTNWVTALMQLQDGRLVSGGNDNMIKLWNSESYECLKEFKANSYEVTALLQLQDGKLVSGGIDNMIRIWDIVTLQCINSFTAHTPCVTSLIQLPNGNIVSGGNDSAIKVWNLANFECITTLKPQLPCVTSFILMRDGLLASVSSSNYIFFELADNPQSYFQKWDI